MDSSSSTGAQPLVDKLSRSAGNLPRWLRTVRTLASLFNCLSAAAINAGAATTPAFRDTPGKLDVDSDDQPVYERNAQQNGQLSVAGKAHYADDLATWKKEKAEDAAQQHALLKWVMMGTISLSSLDLLSDDADFCAHRLDPAAVVHASIRLHSEKSTVDLPNAIRALSLLVEQPAKEEGEVSTRTLVSAVRSAVEGLVQSYGSNAFFWMLGSATIINGLDASIHGAFLTLLRQDSGRFERDQTLDAAKLGFETLATKVSEEGRSVNMTQPRATPDSALSLSAQSRSSDSKAPAKGDLLPCPLCAMLKGDLAAYNVRETDHALGRNCFLYRKVFGACRAELSKRDAKPNARANPKPAAKPVVQSLAANAVTMPNGLVETRSEYVARRLLEDEYDRSQPRGAFALSAQTQSLCLADRSTDPGDLDALLDRDERVLSFAHHLASQRSAGANVGFMSASELTSEQLDAVLCDALPDA